MPIRLPRLSDSDFDRTCRDFERWRQRRPRGARIPPDLWQEALELAAEHGVSKTSQWLRLDYYAVQRRLAARQAKTPAAARPLAEFVEVSLPARGPFGRCQVEMCDSGGEAMRIEISGLSATDMATFVRAVTGREQCCK